jgi:membrane protein implicated in regulation of membrane protease activity
MNWLTDHAWAAWLSLGVLLVVLEMFSLDFVLLMLGIGAFAAGVTAGFSGSFIAELLVGAGVSVGLLGLVRPQVVARLHTGPHLLWGTDKLIGKQSLAESRITDFTPGRIKIDGEDWQAVPYQEGAVIEPGDLVEVLSIRGATAYVCTIPSLEA